MHMCKQVTTPTDVANYTTGKADKMTSTPAEVFFLTVEQSALLYSPLTRVVMTSDYGTGKTTLMKSVIQKLATQAVTSEKQPRIFVIIPLNECSMLFQSFVSFGQEFSCVEVRGLTPPGMLHK